jgi:hypothetical protein
MKWLKNLFGPKCAHLRVRESMACDAWCRDCGKFLGFIGDWREANRNNPQASEIPNDPNDPLSWRPRKEPKR